MFPKIRVNGSTLVLKQVFCPVSQNLFIRFFIFGLRALPSEFYKFRLVRLYVFSYVRSLLRFLWIASLLDPRLRRRGPIKSAPFVRPFVTRFSQNPFVSFFWFFVWSYRVINEQKWRCPIFFENSCCPGNEVKRSFLAQKLTFFKIS